MVSSRCSPLMHAARLHRTVLKLLSAMNRPPGGSSSGLVTGSSSVENVRWHGRLADRSRLPLAVLSLVDAFTTTAEVIGIRKCTEVLNPRVTAVVAELHHHAGSRSSGAPLAPRIAPSPCLHNKNLSARLQSSVSVAEPWFTRRGMERHLEFLPPPPRSRRVRRCGQGAMPYRSRRNPPSSFPMSRLAGGARASGCRWDRARARTRTSATVPL